MPTGAPAGVQTEKIIAFVVTDLTLINPFIIKF